MADALFADAELAGDVAGADAGQPEVDDFLLALAAAEATTAEARTAPPHRTRMRVATRPPAAMAATRP